MTDLSDIISRQIARLRALHNIEIKLAKALTEGEMDQAAILQAEAQKIYEECISAQKSLEGAAKTVSSPGAEVLSLEAQLREMAAKTLAANVENQRHVSRLMDHMREEINTVRKGKRALAAYRSGDADRPSILDSQA